MNQSTYSPPPLATGRETFINGLPERVTAAGACLEAAFLAEAWHEGLERLAGDMRDLANACHAFRLIPTEEAATALADLLLDVLASVSDLTPGLQHKIRSYFDTLRQAAEHAERYAGDTEQSLRMALAESAAPLIGHLIYLLCEQANIAQELVSQLANFGYTVHVFANAAGMAETATTQLPAGFLVDWDHAGCSAVDLAHVLSDIQRLRSRHIPVLSMSSDGGIELRLGSVRAGGDAFFVKPFDITRLIDRLDALIGAHERDPYRVLIVDDSAAQTFHFERILEKGGILTRALNDPLDLLAALNDFHPDLILMDMHMPACSGRELATVIRQQESSDSIPIVFLSSAQSGPRQQPGTQQLGDGFISKELDADQLLSTILSSVERSRTLRSLMQRDSLTGLLNHNAAKRRLESEIQRAKRYGHPLSLAMIDIDHFKKVNDTHGHAAGDTVLKSLARLLQQRLRAADIIGRYGGEEFAVIMPETDGPQAVRILDRIRVSFSQLLHQAGANEFQVHFSGGVAEFPLCETASELSLAADSCLYDAKRSGRNRVILFS